MLSCSYFVEKIVHLLKSTVLSCHLLQIYVFHFPKKLKFVLFGVNGTSFLKDIHRKKSKKKVKKKQVVNNRVQKKDKKVPSPSSKTAQDFLPRSSQSENPVFHFPQKKKIFRFWCEWDLISTRYSKEKTQTNL